MRFGGVFTFRHLPPCHRGLVPTTLASRLQQLEELGGAETGFDVDDGDLDAILNA